MIEVVLTENDPKLGQRGQVVKVSPGYAQNYLFPHHKAQPATPSNLKVFEQEKAKRSKDEAQRLTQAKALAERIRSSPVTLEVMAGEGDKLFGAVTAQDILSELSKKGIVCDRKQVHLEEPIKKLGLTQVEFKLHPEVSAKLELRVVKKA